jgi:hypothetical protein
MEKPESQASKKGSGSYFTSFMTRIGGVFLAPDATFNQIITEKIGFAEPLVLILLLVGIQGAIMASFAQRVISAITSALGPVTGSADLGFLGIIPWIMLVVMVIAVLIGWIVIAGIAHLSARYLFRGTGSFTQLLKLYGYSLAPMSLVILGTVLIGISWVALPLTQFLCTAAVFWIVILMTAAVKQNYSLDTGKAFISSFIGPLIAWLIIVGIFWIWIWLAISSFAGGLV